MKYVLLLLFTMQTDSNNFFSFQCDDIYGKLFRFEQLKGKKLLIVNTASKCGYTPQYADLQKLYSLYKDKLVIIGFPANNFLWQEPGTNEQIISFCQSKYKVEFPMMAKISVKGKDMHPIYQWLISQPNPDYRGDIRWNFEKFLIDESGKVIRRYGSGTNPLDEEITRYLK